LKSLPDGRQRIDGKIPGDDDGYGIEDRPVDVLGGVLDHFFQFVRLALARAQLAEDVLDHHERAVNENAEVDGPDGKQVRRNAFGVQKDEREQQRKGGL